MLSFLFSLAMTFINPMTVTAYCLAILFPIPYVNAAIISLWNKFGSAIVLKVKNLLGSSLTSVETNVVKTVETAVVANAVKTVETAVATTVTTEVPKV